VVVRRDCRSGASLRCTGVNKRTCFVVVGACSRPRVVPFCPFDEADGRRIVVRVDNTEAQDGVRAPARLTLETLAGGLVVAPAAMLGKRGNMNYQERFSYAPC
jgi:hypothetical protein